MPADLKESRWRSDPLFLGQGAARQETLRHFRYQPASLIVPGFRQLKTPRSIYHS